MEVRQAGDPIDRRGHLVELQSLRGLAATLVVVDHCFSYYKSPHYLQNIRDVVGNGDASVVLFFVLSGFVLFRSQAK